MDLVRNTLDKVFRNLRSIRYMGWDERIEHMATDQTRIGSLGNVESSKEDVDAASINRNSIEDRRVVPG